MNLKNYYWYFTGVLTPRFCDHVIEYAKQKKESLGTIARHNKEDLSKTEIKDLKKVRDSNITWLDGKWIYKEIHPYIHRANKSAGWNFDWDWSESCQFTKYKLNQFYDWHIDAADKPYMRESDDPTNGKIRKLSVTCSLSHPEDYYGGELQFDFNNPAKKKKENIVTCRQILKRGSIVVFPSFLRHRVMPVTQGTRYSLVIWNLEYPYK